MKIRVLNESIDFHDVDYRSLSRISKSTLLESGPEVSVYAEPNQFTVTRGNRLTNVLCSARIKLEGSVNPSIMLQIAPFSDTKVWVLPIDGEGVTEHDAIKIFDKIVGEMADSVYLDDAAATEEEISWLFSSTVRKYGFVVARELYKKMGINIKALR